MILDWTSDVAAVRRKSDQFSLNNFTENCSKWAVITGTILLLSPKPESHFLTMSRLTDSLHSTNSALWKVFNDLLWATAIIMLFDLTAAFTYTVDQNVLMSRPEHCVGIKGAALEGFTIYLSDRLDSVSSSPALPLWLPQGSILGPIPFSIYMLPSGSILRYTDDRLNDKTNFCIVLRTSKVGWP